MLDPFGGALADESRAGLFGSGAGDSGSGEPAVGDPDSLRSSGDDARDGDGSSGEATARSEGLASARAFVRRPARHISGPGGSRARCSPSASGSAALFPRPSDTKALGRYARGRPAPRASKPCARAEGSDDSEDEPEETGNKRQNFAQARAHRTHIARLRR